LSRYFTANSRTLFEIVSEITGNEVKLRTVPLML
jgi:hypothetical protein